MDPKRSLALLDILDEFGFDDEAFSKLHHFRLKGRRESISSHRRYCEKTPTFDANGENALVQQRLERVLKSYRSLGPASQHASAFIALAEDAFQAIPPVAERR